MKLAGPRRERSRAAPMSTYVRACSRPWMGTTRCNRYHGLAEEQRELSSTDIHLPTYIHRTGRAATVRYYRVRCARARWRTAAGTSLNSAGAGLCLFRQSVTPRSVIAVIMRPRIIADSMRTREVLRRGRSQGERGKKKEDKMRERSKNGTLLGSRQELFQPCVNRNIQ